MTVTPRTEWELCHHAAEHNNVSPTTMDMEQEEAAAPEEEVLSRFT